MKLEQQLQHAYFDHATTKGHVYASLTSLETYLSDAIDACLILDTHPDANHIAIEKIKILRQKIDMLRNSLQLKKS